MNNEKGSSQKSLEGKVDVILEAVVSLQGQVSTVQVDLSATQRDVTRLTDKVENLTDTVAEILTEMKSVSKAVDKDAITIINHERRIGRLEKQIA